MRHRSMSIAVFIHIEKASYRVSSFVDTETDLQAGGAASRLVIFPSMSSSSGRLLSSLSMDSVPSSRSMSTDSLAAMPSTSPASPGKVADETSAEIQDRDIPENSTPSSQNQSHLCPETAPASTPSVPGRTDFQFVNLPMEIHELILDHLFGEKSAVNPGKSPMQNWGKVLRHPRRKSLSDLALVSRMWTELVQSRIYRHIKVKGTWEELASCALWFTNHQHLTLLVRHVEIWIPVWGDRAVQLFPGVNAEGHPPLAASSLLTPNPGHGIQYHRSNKKATLEEIFAIVQRYFSAARVLTLEGGHCKNSTMVQHFRHDFFSSIGSIARHGLPSIQNIHILIMRGTWNLMRDFQSWQNIVRALPALREWHCGYASPDLGAHFSMMHVLMQPLSPIRHINFTLDELHNANEALLRDMYLVSGNFPLVCRILADAAPLMESFSFTGQVCWYFFESMKKQAVKYGSLCHLRSLDVIAKGCCRKPGHKPHGTQIGPELSGIGNITFIRAFELMIIKVIECLAVLPSLEYVRIRYVDLASICPLLNPYFELKNNKCTGLWSPQILSTLRIKRPSARYVELKNGFSVEYDDNHEFLGVVIPRARPRSIQASMYTLIAHNFHP